VGTIVLGPAPLNAFGFLFNWGSSGRWYWGEREKKLAISRFPKSENDVNPGR